MKKTMIAAACVVATLGFTTVAGAVSLVNGGFEDGTGGGAAGWAQFSNAYRTSTTDTGSAVTAHSGAYAMKMFGNWGWPWNATGAFQQFTAAPGQTWDLQGYGLNWSSDALAGQNFGLLKLSWRDAGGNEISGVDSQHIASDTVKDQWQFLQATGTAPAGTVAVQVFALFLQPNFEGGSAWFDDITVTPEPSCLALVGIALVALAPRRRR
jgi:hypothetical protein